MNVYEEALREIGSWLCYYDARTHYELYGFAGVLNGDEEHIQYFCLSQTTNQKSFHIESTTNAGLDVSLRLPNVLIGEETDLPWKIIYSWRQLWIQKNITLVRVGLNALLC